MKMYIYKLHVLNLYHYMHKHIYFSAYYFGIQSINKKYLRFVVFPVLELGKCKDSACFLTFFQFLSHQTRHSSD